MHFRISKFIFYSLPAAHKYRLKIEKCIALLYWKSVLNLRTCNLQDQTLMAE
jgi:hypothetical protein